jgi:hypothetical protein
MVPSANASPLTRMGSTIATSEIPHLDWLGEILTGRRGHNSSMVIARSIPPTHDVLFSFVAFPSVANPYVLLPSQPAAAAEAINELGNPVHRSLRVAERLLGGPIRSGLAHALWRERVNVALAHDDDPGSPLLSYFEGYFGAKGLALAVIIGKSRPNRKPVVNILQPDGHCLAYAKIGWNEPSKALLDNEARALRSLDDEALGRLGFRVPEHLDRRTVGDVDVLLLGPIPRARGLRRGPPVDLPQGATAAVATLTTPQVAELRSSRYWRDLCSRARGTDVDEPRSERLVARAIDVMERRYGGREIPFGSAHGDWTPWNMRRTGGQLYIWDWERYETSAPIGFDAARFDFEVRSKVRKEEPRVAVNRSIMALGPALEKLGTAPGSASLLAALHLLEMAVRIRQGGSAWLCIEDRIYLPALHALVTRMEGEPL